MSATISVVRPLAGHPGRFERLKAKPIGGTTLGWGEVDIRQPGRVGICSVRVAGASGVRKWLTDAFGITFKCGCGEFHVQARNKVTGLGLKHISNMVAGSASNPGAGYGWRIASSAVMRVGTGTGATTDSTTALTTENTTAPNSNTVVSSIPTAGTYRSTVTATWNAGTLPAVTVTEVGIKGNLAVTTDNGTSFGTSNLFARVSSTDSELTPFLIDVAFPLVLAYSFNQVFA